MLVTLALLTPVVVACWVFQRMLRTRYAIIDRHKTDRSRSTLALLLVPRLGTAYMSAAGWQEMHAASRRQMPVYMLLMGGTTAACLLVLWWLQGTTEPAS